LATELSRTNRVFYVDNPFTLKEIITGFFTMQVRIRLMAFFFGVGQYRRIDPGNPNLINVTPHPALPINFLPPGKVHRFFSRINNAIVRRAISLAIRDYKIKDFIYINSFNPFYFPNLDAFRPLVKIYHCVDNIAASKHHTAKHGRSLEKEMIQTFDLTLTTSQRLCEYASHLSKHAFCLPNAADFKLFQQAREKNMERPKEIEQVHQKIIGYIGHLDHRIDYDLLAEIATLHPEYVLLLVGPTNLSYERSRMEKIPNIITTGSKLLSELPSYLRFMDCGIIPFLCNKLTESIYPLKLNEYLAAAKPVVTTNF
jgi:glycosyltransferase involved in cell wall biosynthesis